MTLLANIMTHTTFTQSNVFVSSAVVIPLFSRMSTCAASASAIQKPAHCTAKIARKSNDKNADMDNHVVLPPDYKAGGDSKREELCQQEPQTFTKTTTGEASSSGRPETFCGCCRMFHCIIDEVKKQADQRISSRCIMYVLVIHDLTLKNIQKRSTLWKI